MRNVVRSQKLMKIVMGRILQCFKHGVGRHESQLTYAPEVDMAHPPQLDLGQLG